MDEALQRRVVAALERPHQLGMIGGDLAEHVAHAARYSELFAGALHADSAVTNAAETAARVHAGDLGTGGGIPGVVLAALHPTWRWTLIDVRSARAQEATAALARLGLEETCEVIAKAAQELGRGEPWRSTFDLLVARSFGPSPLLAECASGLLRIGGALIVSEPPSIDVDERWPKGPLAVLGFGEVERTTVSGSPFAILRKIAPTPENFPRTPPRSDRGWPS